MSEHGAEEKAKSFHGLDYFFFCRPMLHLPVWTFYLLFHKRLNERNALLEVEYAALGMLTLVTAGAYVFNQRYDIESDRANNKLGFFAKPFSLTTARADVMALSLIGISFVCALLIQEDLILPLAVCAFFGWSYSAPPVRAKDRPILGLLYNALPYSLLIWWIAGSAGQGTVLTLLEFSAADGVLIGAVFFAVAGVYLLTTLPDRNGDKQQGKITLGVLLQPRSALALSAFFAFLSFTLAFVVESWSLALVALVSTALSVIATIRGTATSTLIAAKVPIALLTLLLAIDFPIYGLFLLALILLTRIYYKRRLGLVYPRLN